MAWTTHWIGILRHNGRYGHLLSLGFLGLLMFLWLALSNPVWAGSLQNRVQSFPHWSSLPITQTAEGDLVYPEWFEGTWQVDSTLVDLIAPLAPEIVTPGFEGNRQFLQQPLTFLVRFVPRQPFFSTATQPSSRNPSLLSSWQNAWQGWIPTPSQAQKRGTEIVADRAFNGFNLIQAYLAQTGEGASLKAVTVDPENPNRQVTTLHQNSLHQNSPGSSQDSSGQNLPGQDLQWVAIVSDRATETPENDRFQFLTTELTQQFFRSRPQVYLNRVETTTAYHLDPDRQQIDAEQFTAVYLSPQDPQYFQVLDQPVALYHYHLVLNILA